MQWTVTNALSRDVERQQLNKILADIRATCNSLAETTGSSSSSVDMDALAKAVEGNVEKGIAVTYDNVNKTLDFVVNDFTIRLEGDVTGQGGVSSLSGVTITTTIDPSKVGISDAPSDNQSYWRKNAEWEAVPDDILAFVELSGEGVVVRFEEDMFSQWVTRELEAEAGELVITNPDGKAGNPKYGLADLANTGVGASPVKIYTRDAKGRIEGDEDADTDDLPEGVANLYFTDERAQDAVGIILDDTADIELDYDDATPAITGVLTAGVHASLALADSSVQPGDNVSDLVNDAGYLTTAVLSIVPGTNISVDNTDPENPVVSASGGGSGTVTSIDVLGGTGLDSSGGPITTSGAITVDLDAASIASLALADTALQSGDNVSELVNDAGYITSIAGAVTNVTGTAPIASTGGATPDISISAATTGAAGSMSAADKTKLDGVATGATAYTDTDARSAVVIDSIADSDTTHAPSRNAVFDALAGKAATATTLAGYGITDAVNNFGAQNIGGAKQFTSAVLLLGSSGVKQANPKWEYQTETAVRRWRNIYNATDATDGTFSWDKWNGASWVTIASFDTAASNLFIGSNAVWHAGNLTPYTDSAARAAIITSTITNGDTTHSPSGDATFDALALKFDSAGGVITGDVTVGTSTTGFTGTTRALNVTAGLTADNTVGVNMEGTRSSSGQLFARFGFWHQGTLVCSFNGVRGAADAGSFAIATKVTTGGLNFRWQVTSVGHLLPWADNTYNLGEASTRVKELFCANGVINTSDARDKTVPRDMTSDEIACSAALSRLPCVFQWLDAIKTKGNEARLHVSPTVQAVIDVMKTHGLEPFRYGFVCYDEWEELPEVRDDDGLVTQEYRPAGGRYSLRSGELAHFIMRGITARLDAAGL